MNTRRIYLCDDSIDGIFTAVYMAWSSRLGHANIKIEEKLEGSQYSNIELFAEYVVVTTDYELSVKVARSIKQKISGEVYEMICRVALSDFPGKSDLIYRFLILGFSVGGTIIEHLGNEVVHKVFRINKNVMNESHHLLGFIRFSEQENGLLTAIINPKNNVLSIITPHFVDRLPKEKFLIYDEKRSLASLYVPGKPWIMTQVPEIDRDKLEDVSIKEDEYVKLWKTFFSSIAIKERINPKLQRNNLPLRFRGNITEFKS